MDLLSTIRGLVEVIDKSSLTEFSVRDGEFEISMSKRQSNAPGSLLPFPGAAAPIQTTDLELAADEPTFITSPIVGTFYAAPAPEMGPFVKVGDVVKAGQTVCILEAMKLMNEIESEFDCEIEAVIVSNEQKVGYGQPLFRVKKL